MPHKNAADEKIGARLAKARAKLNLSQMDVAMRTRGLVLPTTLSRYETGDRTPKLSHLRALAKALQIELKELVS